MKNNRILGKNRRKRSSRKKDRRKGRKKDRKKDRSRDAMGKKNRIIRVLSNYQLTVNLMIIINKYINNQINIRIRKMTINKLIILIIILILKATIT